MGNGQPHWRACRVRWGEYFRVADGRVVEIGNHRDDLGLLQQTDAQVLLVPHHNDSEQ